MGHPGMTHVYNLAFGRQQSAGDPEGDLVSKSPNKQTNEQTNESMKQTKTWLLEYPAASGAAYFSMEIPF